MGDVLSSLGRKEDARRARQRAGEVSPSHGDLAREKAVQALIDGVRKESGVSRFLHWGIGERLLNEGYLDEAIYHLQAAAFMNTDSPEVLCNLGLALTRRGQYAEALGPLRRGHRLGSARPNWPHPSAQWIRAAERGPELEPLRQAVLEAEASFRRQPGDAATGRALADAYARLFDYPKTAREYLAPDGQLPDDPELWCNLAAMLLLGQETDLHRQLCERALAQAGRLADPRAVGEQRNAYLIARMCALAEKPPVDLARVLELARQSVDRQAFAWHLHTLGLACYRAGKYEEAVRHLNESLTKDPEWGAQVVTYQVLALAYHRLGKADEARRWRDKAAAQIDQTVGKVTWETATAWQPLHPHNLLEMWVLEREIAQVLPASKP
jgi:tetratricopeptide (TPR) repeat protein